MKLAIIGTGVSGLICARLLHRQHHVTLFESNTYVGGHVNTVACREGDRRLAVDTGFIVYNDRTYPNFSRLLKRLAIATRPTAMSFSVRCDLSGLEYNGTSLNGLFSQRTNLWRPSFWRMLADILRFNREGAALRSTLSPELTVADFVAQRGYSRPFVDQYLLPMGAAIWSCPRGLFAEFPIRFILDFYHHHGLLSLRDRPQWRVIDGGSRRYVDALIKPFANRIRLNCPVRSVRRDAGAVVVDHAAGQDHFDEVVFACHADQALRLLSDATATEQTILRAFPYTSSTAVLHTDTSVLPRSRRAWAAWNYHVRAPHEARPTVTYLMNLLQGLTSHRTYLVTLNGQDQIDPACHIASFSYSHPTFTVERDAMQRRHAELIRSHRTSFCGAWWGAGFHEDGVNSALAVCRRFGIDDWLAELGAEAEDQAVRESIGAGHDRLPLQEQHVG